MSFWGWLSNLFAPKVGKVIPLYPLKDDSYVAPWMEIANKELGIQEIAGFKHNLRILQYHEATTLKATDDETPWCSAFACWVMEQYKRGSSPASARARDWLNWGIELKSPIYGCIVVLDRGQGKGHVGFYVGSTKDGIRLLGGNQSNRVCIEEYGVLRVLGYRFPKR